MIIYNEEMKKSLQDITILLKENEIIQLIAYLKELSFGNNKNAHYHLNNDIYSKEITVAMYEKNGKTEHFSDEYKKLIMLDM